MDELTTKVKERIDNYLEFDSDELFKQGDAKIFGGAIRDSIADMPINDIDLICGPLTAKKLHEFVQSKGYKFKPDLIKKDLTSIYSDLKVINEPWTYLKGDKSIDIIRPVGKQNLTPIDYKKHVMFMIENVDISCCAVSYDGSTISESHEKAILHCTSKICCTNPSALMSHHGRLAHRKYKLEERGWTFFESEEEEINLIREANIEKIVD